VSWNNKNKSKDKVESLGFDIEANGHQVPGIYWKPEGGSDRLVLLGHGGGANKTVDYIVNVARLLAAKGIASVAIDGPGHGERAEFASDDPNWDFQKVWHGNGGTDTVIKDWKAALDFIESQEGARPTAWWGLSMGTMMGIPVVASEDRIRVALLGLMGNWGPNAEDLARLAPKVTCPIRYLLQWDDEIVPRDSVLALFDLIGSTKKTLHANPGKHKDVPIPEIQGSVEYLDRYLTVS